MLVNGGQCLLSAKNIRWDGCHGYSRFMTSFTTLGVIGYAIISELFGSNSDTHIFGDALEKVRSHEKVSWQTRWKLEHPRKI